MTTVWLFLIPDVTFAELCNMNYVFFLCQMVLLCILHLMSMTELMLALLQAISKLVCLLSVHPVTTYITFTYSVQGIIFLC